MRRNPLYVYSTQPMNKASLSDVAFMRSTRPVRLQTMHALANRHPPHEQRWEKKGAWIPRGAYDVAARVAGAEELSALQPCQISMASGSAIGIPSSSGAVEHKLIYATF